MHDEQQHDRFVELLRAHHSQLFGYLLALLRNWADAEDLFQQTSLKLWAKFAEFEPGTDFLAWACTIARYDALNFMRSQRRSRLEFSESLQIELARMQAEADRSIVEQRRAALAGCLEKLPEQDRDLVELCYGGDATIGQVATGQGRSKTSIHNSLRRIRSVLLGCIERTLRQEERS